MTDIFDKALTEEEKEDIRDMIATLLYIPAEDRVLLMSNAQTLKARCDLAKARKRKGSV